MGPNGTQWGQMWSNMTKWDLMWPNETQWNPMVGGKFQKLSLDMFRLRPLYLKGYLPEEELLKVVQIATLQLPTPVLVTRPRRRRIRRVRKKPSPQKHWWFYPGFSLMDGFLYWWLLKTGTILASKCKSFSVLNKKGRKANNRSWQTPIVKRED